MVDPIGARGISGRDIAVARVTPVTPSATATATVRAPASDIASLTGVARSLSASPPVDVDHVAQVKRAIADGKFPLLPTTIADRMIAYKLNWRPNEQA